MGKVKTVQVQNRLIIADGEGPLRYVDLDTNKVHVYKKPKVSLKERVLKLFKRKPFEQTLYFKPGKIWSGIDPSDGIKTIGVHPQLMNILQTTAENVCRWHDGTLRPRKGHYGDCHWKFDGSIFWHDIVIRREGFVSPRPPKIYDIEKGEQPINGIKLTGVNKVTEYEVDNG